MKSKTILYINESLIKKVNIGVIVMEAVIASAIAKTIKCFISYKLYKCLKKNSKLREKF